VWGSQSRGVPREPLDARHDLPEQGPCQVAFGELQGEVLSVISLDHVPSAGASLEGKALGASGIFQSVTSAGAGDHELQARIVSQQSQRAGVLAVSSSLVVNYRVRETASGREVWRETIISEETEEGAPFSEGVPGAAKKSLAGAARRNIAEMLEKLAGKIQ